MSFEQLDVLSSSIVQRRPPKKVEIKVFSWLLDHNTNIIQDLPVLLNSLTQARVLNQL